jgi:hypothetical protein
MTDYPDYTIKRFEIEFLTDNIGDWFCIIRTQDGASSITEYTQTVETWKEAMELAKQKMIHMRNK